MLPLHHHYLASTEGDLFRQAHGKTSTLLDWSQAISQSSQSAGAMCACMGGEHYYFLSGWQIYFISHHVSSKDTHWKWTARGSTPGSLCMPMLKQFLSLGITASPYGPMCHTHVECKEIKQRRKWILDFQNISLTNVFGCLVEKKNQYGMVEWNQRKSQWH